MRSIRPLLGVIKVAVLVTAVLVLAGAAKPPSAEAHAPGTNPEFFGVNGAYLRDFVQPTKAATLEGLAASMEAQGIDWARLTFDQVVDERTRGNFNWYAPDTMVAALARHGVRGAGAFIGTAAWAAEPEEWQTCGARSRPYDIGGWSDWVAAAARRYGTNGTFWAQHPELPYLPIKRWEVGNEVNSKIFWCPGANPEQYASVYSASQTAITQVDPQAEVMVAGLAPRFGWQSATDLNVPTFLTRMTAADPSLRDRIPSVAVHPYAETPEGVLGMVSQFRQAMRAAGMPETPMIANEFGWYTQGPAGPLKASEEVRADRIGTVANQLWRTDCGVEGVAPYSWITLEQDPGNMEHWFGLANAVTGAPDAGGLAYGEQIRLALGQATEAPPQDTVQACGPKTLTVEKTGSGSVTSGGGEIDCGQSCSTSSDNGAILTLTPAAGPGYAFRGWIGCDTVAGSRCTVAVNADRSVTARFVARRTLTVQTSGSGKAISSPVGIDCGQSCAAIVDDGATVILYPSADPGYAFRGWSGCDSVGSSNQCTVVMTGDRTVSANFTGPRTLSVQKSGSGTVSSSPAGIDCGQSCAATVPEGTQLSLTPSAAPGSEFRGWSGCDSVAGDRCTVTVNTDRTVSARFVARRTLTVQSSGSGKAISQPVGIDCGQSCAAIVDDGATVILYPSADPGYAFRGWSGCDSVGSSNQCTIVMNGDRTVGAAFSEPRTLSVQKSGSGTVSSSPAGIDCGQSCAATVPEGTQLTLTPSAAPGYAFRGWSGCDSVSGDRCTAAVNADRSVSARFVAQRTLTVMKTGPGTVASFPAGIDCGSSCSTVVDDGAGLRLAATPARGYRFAGWSGCPAPGGTQCELTLSADVTVTATFEPIAPPETWIIKAKVNPRSSTATFTFGGGEGTGALHYSCRVDSRPLRPCGNAASYRLTRGRHTFQVVAEDELGRADPTPAIRTFRVKRRVGGH